MCSSRVKECWDNCPCWGICLIIIAVVAVVVGGITAIVLYFVPITTEFQNSFISKCIKFGGYDCQKVWGAFEQAYVGREKCDVPVEAYDLLIAAAPFNHDFSKTLLWSKTRDGVVEKFNENKGLVILGDTLFGNVTKGYKTWCGKKGSKETFTYYCPGLSGCENNPVRSYWNRVSAAFAKEAAGTVTALLSGSTKTPFDPESTFAKFEVPALQPGRVTRLNVVLITQKNSEVTCENPSLNSLSNILQPKGIYYNCNAIPESQI